MDFNLFHSVMVTVLIYTHPPMLSTINLEFTHKLTYFMVQKFVMNFLIHGEYIGISVLYIAYCARELNECF